MSENTNRDIINPNEEQESTLGPSEENNEDTSAANEQYDTEQHQNDARRRDTSEQPATVRFPEDPQGAQSRSKLVLNGPMSMEQLHEYIDDCPAENVLRHAGDFGLFQKLLFLGMCPYGCFFALVYFVQFFITLTPEHWCRVPELAFLSAEDRRQLAIPKEGKKYDGCHMYDVDWLKEQKIEQPAPNTPKVKCKYGYEYEYHEVNYPTITSELNWVCSKHSYPTIAQSVFFAGSCVGGLISGWMADTYGRIPALMAANLLGCVGGVASTFTKALWSFTLCRFIAGMAFDNCFMIMFILALEYVGMKQRTLVANMAVAIYFGGTLVIMPWVAKSIANWRTYVYVTTLPMLIALVAPWTIPESAKWLVTRGKKEQARQIIAIVEKINGTKVPEDVMTEFLESTNDNSSNESLLDMFRDAPMRLMILMLLIVHGTESLVYDVIVRISESLGMDVFVTFSVSSLTELPSNIIIALMLDKQGRKQFAIVPMSMAGVLLLVAGFVPKGLPMVMLSMLSRFLIIIAFNTVTQWTFECLPTTVRASGSSLIHICGFIANILAPSVVFSGRAWAPLPFLLISFLALICAGLCVLLPETKDKNLPQTMLDAKLLFYTTRLGKHYMKNSSQLVLPSRSKLLIK